MPAHGDSSPSSGKPARQACSQPATRQAHPIGAPRTISTVSSMTVSRQPGFATATRQTPRRNSNRSQRPATVPNVRKNISPMATVPNTPTDLTSATAISPRCKSTKPRRSPPLRSHRLATSLPGCLYDSQVSYRQSRRQDRPSARVATPLQPCQPIRGACLSPARPPTSTSMAHHKLSASSSSHLHQ